MSIIKIPVKDMTQKEWEESRKGSIGGSDAAALLGLNPWSSPYALWGEKTGKIPAEDISGKEAVRLGHFLEPYVADRFAEETGKKVRRENFILKNSDYPWAHANVDRMVIGEKAGLECKTTSELNLKTFRGGEYPANYYCQCMHYMAVTGFRKWYLAVLIGNREFRIFEIERNEEEISALMEAEERFWEHVRNGTPPPTDGLTATSEALGRLYPEKNESVDLTPVCKDLRQYVALKAEMKLLEHKIDGCANAVKEFMQGANKGTYDGISVSWSNVQSSRFDRKAFQKANPEIDLSPFFKVSESRRFLVK